MPTSWVFSLLLSAKLIDIYTTYFAIENNYGYEMNDSVIRILNIGGYPLYIVISIMTVSLITFVFYVSKYGLEKTNAPQRVFIILPIMFSLFLIMSLVVIINNIHVIITHLF
jgi:hypothetical protein